MIVARNCDSENKGRYFCISENVFKARNLCIRHFDVNAVQATCHLRLECCSEYLSQSEGEGEEEAEI